MKNLTPLHLPEVDIIPLSPQNGFYKIYLRDGVAYKLDSNGVETPIGSFVETDPIFTSSPAYTITNQNITNWNTAYSWGDHSTEEYLKVETDPVFTASPAYGISNTMINQWIAAYSWGNHATQGYLTQAVANTLYSGINHTHSFSQITSKPTTLSGYGITDPVVLTNNTYNDPSWIGALSWSKIIGAPSFVTALAALTDVQLTTLSENQILRYSNGFWRNWSPNFLTQAAAEALYIPYTALGTPNGVASLNSSGQIPTSQLPSYVDDVLEYASTASFPATGETGKIYVALDTNETYRWGGTSYVRIANGAVQSVNSQTGNVVLTTDNISEGSTNLYFTSTRVQTVADALYVALAGAYSNPSWITSLAWSKITGAPAFLTGSGTTNYVTKWSAGTLVNSIIYENGGVGIGTTNPSTNAMLTVVGGLPSRTKSLLLDSTWDYQTSFSMKNGIYSTEFNLGGATKSSNEGGPGSLQVSTYNATTGAYRYPVTFYANGNVSFAGALGSVPADNGNTLQVNGTIQQSSVTGALLKASASGVLVAAVAGVDYLVSVTTPTLDSVTTAGNTTTNAITVGGITSNGSIVIGGASSSGALRIYDGYYAYSFGSATVGYNPNNNYTRVYMGASITYTENVSGNYIWRSAGSSVFAVSNGRVDFYDTLNNVVSRHSASTGNFMVGTTTDSGYKLDVNGTARVSGSLYFSTSGSYLYGDTNNIRLYDKNNSIILQAFPSGVASSETYLKSSSGSKFVRINDNAITLEWFNANSSNGEQNPIKIVRGFFGNVLATDKSVLNITTPFFSNLSNATTLRGIYIDINDTSTYTGFTTVRAIETVRGDVIFNGGNLGIGTTTPTGRNGYGGGTVVEVVNNTTYASLNLNGGSAGSPTYLTFGAQNSGADIRVNNKSLQFTVNSIDALRIATTGNVLINAVTDAGYKFDVNGSVRFKGAGTTSSTNAFVVQNGSGTTKFFVDDSNVGASIKISNLINGYSTLEWPANIVGIGLIAGGSLAVKVSENQSFVVGESSSPVRTASSILTVNSSNQGFLQPRMTNTQALAIATPATGLQLYDTTNNKNMLYESTAWRNIATESWVAAQGYVTSVATPTLDQVTTAGNTTTNSITVANLNATTYVVASTFWAGNAYKNNNNGNMGMLFSGSDIVLTTGASSAVDTLHLFGATQNVGIGTATDAGYRLDVTGTARVTGVATANQFNAINNGGSFQSNGVNLLDWGNGLRIGYSASVTRIAMYTNSGTERLTILNSGFVGFTQITPTANIHTSLSVTAASAIARGVYFNNTLVAAANNDVLVGLDIAPTYTNGAFTGINNIDLRTKNAGLVIGSGVGYGAQWGYDKDGLFQIKTNGEATEVWFRPNSNPININDNYWTSIVQTVQNLKILPGNYQNVYIRNRATSGAVYLGGSEAFNSYGIYIPANSANVLINTTTDSGYKLDVNGTFRSVVSTETNPFRLEHTNGNYMSMVVGAGSALAAGQFGMYFNGSPMWSWNGAVFRLHGNTISTASNPSTLILQGGYGGSTVGTSIRLSSNTPNQGQWTATTGAQVTVEVGNHSNETWSPSSGNASYTLLSIAPRINTTGTYAGIVRGLYYNPTLTSVTGVTHRAIETVTGDVIFGSTSGNVGIGTTSPANVLDVRSTAASTGVDKYTGFTARIQNTKDGDSVNAVLLLVNQNGGAGGYYIRGLNNQQGEERFYVNGNGNIWSIGSGTFVGNVRATQIRWNTDGDGWIGDGGLDGTFMVVTNGIERYRVTPNGNLLLNTTTDAGYKLDVNGITRVTGTDIPGVLTVGWGKSNTITLGSNTANSPQIYLGSLSLTAHPGGSSLSIDPGFITTTNQGSNTNRPITIAPTVTGTSTGNIILLSSGARLTANRHVPTSGVLNMVMVGGATPIQYMDFAPSSGNAEFNSISIVQQINTSGTYAGIVRGIYYNPILTSITGVTHRAIETVTGDVILGSTSGNVGIGTSTLGTATELTVGGAQTAASAIARGQLLNTTLVQSAASDVLTAFEITPTFTVDPTLLHNAYWMRFTGAYSPSVYNNPNNTATTIDLSNSFTNTFQAIGLRIRHTYSNVQVGYGILLESASYYGIVQTSTASTNFLAGKTVIGSSTTSLNNEATLNVINGTNGGIKVGGVGGNSQHLIISHSEAGQTFSSIRSTFNNVGSSMLIDVAGQNNLRLWGTGNVVVGGTTDAGYKLDVNGTARVQGVITGSVSSGGSLILGAANANERAIYVTGYFSTGGAIVTNSFNLRSFNTTIGGQENGLILEYTGNTQAVTNSINRYFVVAGNINTTNGTMDLQGYSFTPTVVSETGATIKAFVSTLSAASNRYNLYLSGTAQNYIAGNLGVGIPSPAYKLHVAGTTVVQNTSNAALYINETGGNTGDVANLYLIGNNMGWGASLRYNVGAGGANNRLDFYTGTSRRMSIAADTGNILINTITDAGYKLDVNGSARINGQFDLPSQGAPGHAFLRINDNGTLIRTGSWNFSNSSGNVWVGGSEVVSSLFTLNSTNKGFMPPRMTSAQRMAISSPGASLIVFDTDIQNLCYYRDGVWVQATFAAII